MKAIYAKYKRTSKQLTLDLLFTPKKIETIHSNFTLFITNSVLDFRFHRGELIIQFIDEAFVVQNALVKFSI